MEPLCPSTLPEKPWERLGADLFELNKTHYLLLVDYFSRWIEVRKLSSLTANAVVTAIKSIFSFHGICDVLISDNGPQFASSEFRTFIESYGFTHLTSSPHYPRTNGEAERSVGTVKRMWNKSQNFDLSMLTYRATPLENGDTPSELLMGRMLRTTLSTWPETLQHIDVDRDRIEDQEFAQRVRTKRAP